MDFGANEFKQKTILVTGAGRGVGKRLALGFARLGARIALIGRSKAELDLAKLEIEQNGGNALRIRADVNDPEQMAVAIDRTRVAFGRAVDVLICAAGIAGPLEPFANSTVLSWTAAITTNLMGVMHSCKAVLPDMIAERRGKIIVVACSADAQPKLHMSAYETSKAAAVRFVESVSLELIEHNIQINSFDPGPAYTSFTDEIIEAADRMDPKVVSQAKETRRTGGTSPDLQFEHIAFLASEASNHVSGKLIHVSDDWKKLRNAHLKPDALTLRRAVLK